jgi:hypothetical protein
VGLSCYFDWFVRNSGFLYLLLIECSFDLGFNLASFCALVPKEIELEAREINISIQVLC